MLEQYESDASYCCTQCSHQTVWQFQLDHHNQRSHGNVNTAKLFSVVAKPELYPCAYCDFKTFYELVRYEHCVRMHYGRNRGDEDTKKLDEFKSYSCKHCGHRGHSSIYLIKHDESCRRIRKNPLADPNLPTSSFLKSAVGFDCDQPPTESTLEQYALLKDAGTDNDAFCCLKCPYRAKLKRNLTRHMQVHVEDDKIKWFNCDTCSYKTKRKDNLKKHVDVIHAKRNAIKRFGCTECSYRSHTKARLALHMMRHAPPEQINWYNCTSCSYRSKHKKDLRSHQLSHDEANWLDCAECSFRTHLKMIMKQHMLVHDTKAAFSCAQCSYAGKRKFDLNVHMMFTHAAVDETKWIHCPKCPYRSPIKGHVKRHMLTHDADNDGWFDCTECSFQAKSRGSLKLHMRAHASSIEQTSQEGTTVKPRRRNPRHTNWISCTECSHTTKRESLMKAHMLTRHANPDEIEWFNCTECSYRGKQKLNVKRHMAKHHAAAEDSHAVFLKSEPGEALAEAEMC